MLEHLLFYILFAIPAILTIWNIVVFIQFFYKKSEKMYNRIIEFVAFIVGFIYLSIYFSISEIKIKDWNVPIYFGQKHSIISTDTFLTITVIISIAFLGYLFIRNKTVEMLSPIVSALGIASFILV